MIKRIWAILAVLLLVAPSLAQAAPLPLKVRWAPTAAPSGIPDLNPSAAWISAGGVLNTVAVPTDPTRGSWPAAKPMTLWQMPSAMRLVTDQLLCVASFANNGGTASVEIGSESATGVMAAFTNYSYTTPRGTVINTQGWCVNVKAAAFRAVTTTGGANFWARSTGVDGTMQQRVIGGPLIQSGYDTEQYGGNYPMTMYPRPNETDTAVTVCGTGGANYTTIKGAMDFLQGTSFEAPLVTITCNGNYIVANAAGMQRSTGMRAVLTIAPGVVATLGQASIDYVNTATWSVDLGWDGVEFRGNTSGSLTIDCHWLHNFKPQTQPDYFNAMDATNSVGDAKAVYWNGFANPSCGSDLPSYLDDVHMSHINGMQLHGRFNKNVVTTDTIGSVVTGSHYVYNNHLDGLNVSFFQALAGRGVTIKYTDPGGHTTATIERSGNGDSLSGADLIAKVDGSTICTRHLGYYTTDTIATVSQAITDWNSNCPNFVMTLQGADRANFRASSIGGLSGFGPTNVYNVTTGFPVGLDPHAEWWQGHTGGGIIRQNVILDSNYVINVTDEPFINSDADVAYDWAWIRNVFSGTNNNYPTVGGPTEAHFLVDQNTVIGGFVRRELDGSGNPIVSDNTYSSAHNNIVLELYVSGNTTAGPVYFPNSWPWKNTAYSPASVFGTPIIPNGPNDTGNVNYSPATLASLFQNLATGDVRPATAGFLLSNQFTARFAVDQRQLPFAATDVAGAWSKNDPAP